MLTFSKLTTFIINLARKSLQIELGSFFKFIGELKCTKQAFSEARKKLSSMVFKQLNEKLIIENYSDNTVKTYKGLRVLAIDGSTIKLPKNKELFEAYGDAVYNSEAPLARTSMVYDVLNKITLDACLRPYRASEKSLAMEHIEEIEKQNKALTNKAFDKDLILLDRGYASLAIMLFLQTKKMHWLMRVPAQFLSEVNAVVKAGLRDAVITIPAFKIDRNCNKLMKQYHSDLDKDTTIAVRVVVFDLSSGEKEIIVTSLIDQKEFSYNDIFELYALRWNVEEGYKFYKCTAEIQNFSGKSKLAIEQDFFATIFTCNINSLLVEEAEYELNQAKIEKDSLDQMSSSLAEKATDVLSQAVEKPTTDQSLNKSESKPKPKYEYKVNRSLSLGIVKDEIIDVFLSDRDLNEYCDTLKTDMKKNLVPIRPNREQARNHSKKQKTINRRAF